MLYVLCYASDVSNRLASAVLTPISHPSIPLLINSPSIDLFAISKGTLHYINNAAQIPTAIA